MRSPGRPRKIGARALHAAWSTLVAGVTVGALLAGCDAKSFPALGSFETRCAQLPAARFHVVTVPMVVTEDDTEDVAQLTVRSGASADRHRTYGLTVANFGHETESRLRILEEASTGRACATPEVDVTLSMRPTTVYLARELAGDRCQREATRQHELRHVDAYRALLDEAAARLRAELPAAVAREAWSGGSAGDVRRRFDATLRAVLGDFMRTQHEVLAERQAGIDTPEEYARVGRACRAG
jgi:hypothetical protein